MSLKHVFAALVATAGIGAANAQGNSPSSADWATIGRFLSLVQVFMQAACPPGAAQPCDPNAAQKAIDEIANGRNSEANALMLDLFAEVPAPEREKMLAIGRSMVAMNRKQMAEGRVQMPGDSAAMQARKDLTAIGLSYHDRDQFLDAVRRKDAIAVRLFLTGRGVDPNAKDAWGNSALELARRGGDPEIIALLTAAR
jgi:hypothetical protein